MPSSAPPDGRLASRLSRWTARWSRWAWPGAPTRWRDVPRRLRPTVMHTGRLTVAGVLAYLLTLVLTDGPVDLTGALTALLVCQASALSSVRMGLVRVGAVLTGVIVAVTVSSWVGLNWWSLGIAIGTSLLLAKVFRLGDQALETPISAMLILSAGGQEIAVETRLVTTLIGAAVGIGINLAFPPTIPTRAAISSVRWVALELGECLDRVAESLALAPLVRGDVEEWLDSVRAVSGRVARASSLVQSVKDARKLNPRALTSRTIEPPLRTGLDRLEQCQLALRSLLLLMAESAPSSPTPDDGYGEEVRIVFSVVMSDVATSVRAFGDLVAAEARGEVAEMEETLEQALEALGETRAVLTELMMVDPATQTGRWMLRGSILAGVEQILALLAVGVRRRERERWHATAPSRRLPPLRRDALPDWRSRPDR
ncbi:FUSC family protein [Arsenicicoccus sp. oral taxon 190]|uniref:FUSC family protein n=1 Tax=Arsenicicoccus sp. oral taxon 190 TaxID=1658671 RepID=UPI00067DDC1C|nr:aromatic acid exporter family protein [Arsenicicoccus sp. oral taxon 190]